ncbi:Fungal lipase-like domain containing protein [Heracleum sosnowskyi]|uniref:Fungal lipase-like domain containing protein n=1 Tax=Heracleum sosnowskyi TaxID=360622 RepID=A0AAD8IXN0_9APIA|nr:Fungal lipase-like domain containing protein [Heracleum sosnowskyi]
MWFVALHGKPDQTFHKGALHLTAIDWKSLHHRTSVAASLVQATYILERDRQEQRQGPQALAPGWWDFFHFQLYRVLVDDTDNSIIGAIYEFKYPPYDGNLEQKPPRYVIAFRGTIRKESSLLSDLKSGLQFIGNLLHNSHRFQIAMQAIQEIISLAGAANIWLTGHSLGAAIALLAGKNMAKVGCPIKTYLFNPPFASAPVDIIKIEKVKHGVRIARSLITAGIAAAVSSNYQKQQRENYFQLLSTWIPYLFLNPSDPICSEYIGYFEHRGKMAELGFGEIGRVATQHSLGSLFSTALGKDIEAIHLLPSAYLTMNMNCGQDFKECHEIHQWWKQDFQWQSKLHQFS